MLAVGKRLRAIHYSDKINHNLFIHRKLTGLSPNMFTFAPWLKYPKKTSNSSANVTLFSPDQAKDQAKAGESPAKVALGKELDLEDDSDPSVESTPKTHPPP